MGDDPGTVPGIAGGLFRGVPHVQPFNPLDLDMPTGEPDHVRRLFATGELLTATGEITVFP